MSETTESEGDFSFLLKGKSPKKRDPLKRGEPRTMEQLDAENLEKLQQEYLWRYTFRRIG